MSRASIIGLLVFVATASGSAFLSDEDPKPKKLWVFIGTYTEGGSKGIYRSELDLATGRLTPPVLAGEAKNPSFLAIHPSRKFLYAVGEVDDFDGKKTGGVSAFAIDPRSGKLTLLNQQPSGGAGPCHIVVDAKGKHVLVANYSGGSVGVLPITDDGRLGQKTALIQHAGSSVHASRQKAPHAHSINLDAANRFAFVADLGLDKVLIYRFDASRGTLDGNDSPDLAVAPGAGPRHFAFHPNGKHAYAINELNSTVSVLDYDPGRGALKETQTVSTLPAGFSDTNHTAEIQVHPSGEFAYGSNRGHDSIAMFGVGKNGQLTLMGNQSSGIKTPRNFTIDPAGGAWMLVGNQTGDNVAVFSINPKTGALDPTEHKIDVPRPVCIRMMSPGP